MQRESFRRQLAGDYLEFCKAKLQNLTEKLSAKLESKNQQSKLKVKTEVTPQMIEQQKAEDAEIEFD